MSEVRDEDRAEAERKLRDCAVPFHRNHVRLVASLLASQREAREALEELDNAHRNGCPDCRAERNNETGDECRVHKNARKALSRLGARGRE